jgi:hypothetical protein
MLKGANVTTKRSQVTSVLKRCRLRSAKLLTHELALSNHLDRYLRTTFVRFRSIQTFGKSLIDCKKGGVLQFEKFFKVRITDEKVPSSCKMICRGP